MKIIAKLIAVFIISFCLFGGATIALRYLYSTAYNSDYTQGALDTQQQSNKGCITLEM